VVDNGSTDGSDRHIEEAFPSVRLLRLGENFGFAAANNLAIAIALADGADYLWCLNNDTIVESGCLTACLDVMEQDVTIAAVSPKIYYEGCRNTLWYAGGYIDWRTMQSPHTGQGEKDTGQYDKERDVGFLTGCSMLFRRSVVQRVGVFDGRLFAYYEDLDWCVRAANLRLRLRYVPRAVLWHKVSASVRKNTITASGGTASPFAYYLIIRNRMWMIRKHCGDGLTRGSCMASWGYDVVELMLGMVVLRRWDKLRGICKGVRDGVFGGV
jgi:GT2 family glycosyltransferase